MKLIVKHAQCAWFPVFPSYS